MSEARASQARASQARVARLVALAVAAVLGLTLPAVLEGFWVQLGAVVFSASIGAIGLTLLFGRVGQLSLGHPFFLAVGAYAYVWVASPADDDSWGLGLPALVGLPVAAIVAGLAGLALSPIAARLKGLSLGLATLALIFVGLWLLYTLEPLTGGYNGRNAPPLQIGPFSSAGSQLALLGVPIGRPQFLWYVTLLVLVGVILFTLALLRGRVGRAFTAIRDAEVHAAALGVEVGRWRGAAFTVSSAYAGLAGALLAVSVQRVVPDYWGLALSLSYLAMVVIGGLGSVGGAVLGAGFVTVLPAMLQRYGDAIPGVGTAGGEGLGPAVVAQLAYGLAVVAVLIFEPQGLAQVGRRILRRRTRAADSPAEG